MNMRAGSLRHFTIIKNGTTPASGEASYWDGDIAWATPDDLGQVKSAHIAQTKRSVTRLAVTETNLNVVPSGTVLMSTRAPVGHMAIASIPMAFNQGCRGLIAREGTWPPYLLYVLQSRVPELNATANGTTFVELSRDDLASVRISLPSIESQQRVAAFLDEKTAQIDALVAKKQTLLERLAEKRQAIITQVVTKGLNPAAPMKYSGIEWLGRIPAHWAVKRLKHLAVEYNGLQMGPFGGMLTELSAEATGYKLYGQENTISGDFNLGHRWLDKDRFNALKRYQLVPGDLVITRKGSLGSCRRVPDNALPGIADSDTIIIRVDEFKIRSALAILLLHDAAYIASQIEQNRRGAILAGLNTAVVGNLGILCPPLSEQDAITDWCRKVVNRLDEIVISIHKSIEKITEYRSILVTAAVTGQIEGPR
jgi:type I restriction enzyme, S subunit